jgi:hypothetical protein
MSFAKASSAALFFALADSGCCWLAGLTLARPILASFSGPRSGMIFMTLSSILFSLLSSIVM